MRSLSLLASVLLTFSAAADTATTKDKDNDQEDQSTPTPSSIEVEAEEPTVQEEEKPNEIIAGPLTFSGAAIEVLKTDSLFQLINPAAPESYGYAEDNVVRDPIDRKVSGIKLFSIKF